MKPTLPKTECLELLNLFPYQSAFAANDSRFKIGLWARQTGKDHTAAAEAVVDCLYHPGTTWIILGASERQALETLAKARELAELISFDIDHYSECAPNLPLAVARTASTEIKWSNGSRLIALPANPGTIRGYSGNLILTEFAFHEDSDAIWRAIYPSISNPLRVGPKKLRIISTPNGLTNKFADLWLNTPNLNPLTSSRAHEDQTSFPFLAPLKSQISNLESAPSAIEDPSSSSLPSFPFVENSSSAYFKSKVTLHDAIAAGLPLNAAELQFGLNDPDAWSQEYLCEFMDSSTVMFPYDLIAPCESEQATETSADPNLNLNRNPNLFAGIDFGRKHHLTVCWILERVPNPNPTLFMTREVLTLKNMSTPDQIEILRPRLQRCRKICLDYTGAGIGLGDYLVKTVGMTSTSSQNNSAGKIDLCQFTNSLKSELFPRLRAAFEQRLLRIPISREIREDLHAIQRTVTQSGQITYRAPHTADGHSDRTTALSLALRAATSAPPSACAQSIWVPGRTADLRWAMGRSRRASRRTAIL